MDVRCPSLICRAGQDNGVLNADGSYACYHCATFLTAPEFQAWVDEMKTECSREFNRLSDFLVNGAEIAEHRARARRCAESLEAMLAKLETPGTSQHEKERTR